MIIKWRRRREAFWRREECAGSFRERLASRKHFGSCFNNSLKYLQTSDDNGTQLGNHRIAMFWMESSMTHLKNSSAIKLQTGNSFCSRSLLTTSNSSSAASPAQSPVVRPNSPSAAPLNSPEYLVMRLLTGSKTANTSISFTRRKMCLIHSFYYTKVAN